MLLVLGVHRSGTSLIARMLECFLGVNSRHLMPAGHDNPKRYFEDSDIFHFNQEMLLPRPGRKWHDLEEVDWNLLSMVGGRYEDVPGRLLPRYDLVFAVGRCALEAAASGCGVIPVYRNMADELLGTENYERLRAQNMSVRLSRHEKLTKAWIIKQIDRWDGADIGRVAKRIREDASLDGVANQLENIYRRVAADFPLSARLPLEEELCAAFAVLRDEDWQELHRAKLQAFELARRLHDSENRNVSLEQDVHAMPTSRRKTTLTIHRAAERLSDVTSASWDDMKYLRSNWTKIGKLGRTFPKIHYICFGENRPVAANEVSKFCTGGACRQTK